MKKYIFGGIVLVVILLLGVGIGYSLTPVTTQAPLVGDVVNNSNYNFTDGIKFGNVKENWAADKIIAKQNQAWWKNTTGQTQYVDLADVSTDGTASSTYKVYVYASTTKVSTLYDFTVPVSANQMLVGGFKIATSSVATTTSNYDLAGAGKVVRVPDQSYVNILLSGVDSGCASSGSGVCETATSTNRGFNLFWRLHYHN